MRRDGRKSKLPPSRRVSSLAAFHDGDGVVNVTDGAESDDRPSVRPFVRRAQRREGRGRGRAAAEFAALELETEAAVCPLSTGRDRRGVVGEGGDSGRTGMYIFSSI